MSSVTKKTVSITIALSLPQVMCATLKYIPHSFSGDHHGDVAFKATHNVDESIP